MSENKRALLSLTETDITELRNLLAAVYAPVDEDIPRLHDKWTNIMETTANVLSSPVPLHFTDLGTEP